MYLSISDSICVFYASQGMSDVAVDRSSASSVGSDADTIDVDRSDFNCFVDLGSFDWRNDWEAK